MWFHSPVYSRKLYATGSATANGVAIITVATAARLLGVQWAVDLDSITDGAGVVLELSATSATEIAVNEAQQCLSEVRWFGNFVTSGLAQTGINLWVPLPMVPCTQGQKLYLHAVISGTVVYRGGGTLWFA